MVSNPKNKIYVAKGIGFYKCIIIISKHEVLSYQDIPWSQIDIYYCAPVGEVQVPKLSMGGCNSPDIFQEKIPELFKGFVMVHAYIYGIMVSLKNTSCTT